MATLDALPAVDIIYDHQGADTHHFSASVQAGVKAIVLAATGQGSLSPPGRRGCEACPWSGLVRGSCQPSVARLGASGCQRQHVWAGCGPNAESSESQGVVAIGTL